MRLSPKNMSKSVKVRWDKSRKDLFRSVLRDPGASKQAKIIARMKLESITVQG